MSVTALFTTCLHDSPSAFFVCIRPQATHNRACDGYNLSRVPGLAGRSEDFLYASNNVGDPLFLFEKALPIIGSQRIGSASGGHGVSFM
jgi:hypothetical protein